jgi:DNA-binding response OmpR family regulator/predicted regulator of Ras-like GTPase activity (Roadblock/LC7/MglB family)
LAQYSILIADGDPENIQYLSGTLRANGFNSSGTSSGTNALSMYKAEAPDLVVADLNLAEIDGLELLEELRAFDPQAKVILTTNSANKELIARAFRMGALDILEKPLNFEFLTNKIRELVSRENRALEGNLEMMSLASIVQINCEERNQAQLILNYQGKTGTIYFKDGEMIHAEIGGKTGEEAVFELLSWEDGSFQLSMGAEPSLQTIDTPWSGVILEGMRRIDETTAGWSPDWDSESSFQDDEGEIQVQERIAKAILSTSEVSSAVICATDGTLIAQENSSDPDSDIQLGVLLSEKADNIGGFLEAGDLTRVVITGAKNRFYLQTAEGNLILLSLTKRSSAETIFESVKTIQKRYQSA